MAASGFGVCVGGGCDRGGGVVEGNSERILERRARASERECVCASVREPQSERESRRPPLSSGHNHNGHMGVDRV